MDSLGHDKPLYGRERARRSLMNTVVYRVIAQGCTILGYIVMVRGMTEHDFGVFNLLYALLPVMSTVASLGLEQSLRRFQPEYLRSGQERAAIWLVRFVGSARFLTNLLLIGALLIGWNLFAPTFQLAPYRIQFALFSFLILLHFQSNVLTLSLSSHMLHQYSVGFTALLAAVKLIAYLVIVKFDALTLQNAIFADTAAYGLFYAGLYVAHRRHCRNAVLEAQPFHLAPEERRRLVRYSFFNNFNDAGTLLLNTQSDNFFIAAMMNPVAVGAYAFCTRLSQMSVRLMPTHMFQNIIQPVFFSIPTNEAAQRIPRYLTFLFNIALLLQLPIVAYVTVYHAQIVEVLFAGKFSEYSALLPIVFAFSALNIIMDPVSLAAQHAEKAWVMLLSKIFAIGNVIGLLVAIPVAGLYGAAISTGLSQLLKNLFIWWHVRATARWTNWSQVFVAVLIFWGGFILIAILLRNMMTVHPLIHLVIGGALAAATALLFARSRALCTTDHEILASLLHGRESRLVRLLIPIRRDA